MKNTIQTAIIQLAVTIPAFLFSVSAYSSNCSLRNDTMIDTRDLGEFVKAEMTPFKKVSLKAGPSDRYFKIDRNNTSYPELNILNYQGVLTSVPDVNVKKIKNSEQGYAQTVPFTKCHWFTNLHVVKGIADERNAQVQLGTEVYGSFGQGSACEGKESFKASGLKAKLAGFNPAVFENGSGELINDRDWAVLSASKSSAAVQPVRICETSLTTDEVGIAAGTPAQKLDEQGFSVIGGEIVQAEKGTGTGLIWLTNKTSQPGKSGGGIYKVDDKGLCLAALNVGSGKVLKISTILKQLKQSNPDLVDDIKRVMAGGECK